MYLLCKNTFPTLLPEWRYSTASATECRPINFFGSIATCMKKRERLRNRNVKSMATANC